MSKQNNTVVKILLLVIAAVAVGFALLLVFFSGQKQYELTGPSMEPTLQKGERVITTNTPAAEVARGEIIVFNSPSHDGVRQIKRVVGLPGDKITEVDGVLVVEKADGGTYKPYGDNQVPAIREARVTTDSFYVVGDNYNNSLDSRIADFGLVPFGALLGTVQQ